MARGNPDGRGAQVTAEAIWRGWAAACDAAGTRRHAASPSPVMSLTDMLLLSAFAEAVFCAW